MSRKLVVIDGSRERELMLVGRLVVGRDPACDITYDDALLSRRHAEFVSAGDQVTVRDLGSRNGVFVNGAKIAERALRSGDVVQIGPVRARYIADDAPVSIAPDEVDADHTAVIHRDKPALNDDDERTRITGAPRGSQPPDSMPPAPALAVDDDERTLFLQSPRPNVPPKSATEAVAAAPSAEASPRLRSTPAAAVAPAANPQSIVNPQSVANPQSATRNPQFDGSLSTFVFAQSLVLAVIVLVAAAIPLLMWRRDVAVDQTTSAPLLWLALPVAVALIAAYLISAQINRRFVHTLAAVERKRS